MDTYGVPSTHCIGSNNSTHVKYTPSVTEKLQLYHSAHKPINMQKDVCTPTFLFNKWAILERTQYCDGGRLREGRDASGLLVGLESCGHMASLVQLKRQVTIDLCTEVV